MEVPHPTHEDWQDHYEVQKPYGLSAYGHLPSEASVRRVKIAFASSCPHQVTFAIAQDRLRRAAA